ncbi:GNAT family N-acetyltransferase [Planomonospora sp. ID82291]|uniref:GNAT family N-acetyltransferase n=1 Tax=Planomonospora sp. ID82291 TaxID=2738136 RepID=UPI0018C43581|nr:GNAT family N-acetyltransferase [Planomonospora sp. ID82291]MBG0813923.1 GNAT family N-acetyltransferase [Planomonospora sp. ID82291]
MISADLEFPDVSHVRSLTMFPSTIRTATPDDAALTAELNRFVQDIHAEHRPDLFRDHPPIEELTAGFRSQLEREDVTIFIAERPDGGAVGYAMTITNERSTNALMHADSFVVLEHLAVAPDVARHGVGRALVNAVREAARAAGCRRLVTEVWDFNSRASAFFESSGFAPMHRRLEQML